MQGLKIGCIADDFTGASDAASYLQLGGLRTALINGIPRNPLPDDVQAAVIALKTRSIPAKDAVSISENAAKWLLEQGAGQLYFKYCSTFDSTEKGNIGPVTDRLMEITGCKYTIVCPALPDNGRTVRGGRLYVNGVPLEESPMRCHPITPMRDSDLTRLMGAQSRRPCLRWTGTFPENMPDFCTLVPDYETEDDARRIIAAFGHLPLLTGGSGLLRALARRCAGENSIQTARQKCPETRQIVISGSCSQMTRRQVAEWIHAGKRSLRIDPEALLEGRQTIESMISALESPGDILFYSTAEPDSVARSQRLGRDRVSRLLEDAMAQIACAAVRRGEGRLIIAGGETSSAAMQMLGFERMNVGKSLAPGVPILYPADAPGLRLVLKSGNFGDAGFFLKGIPQE